MEKLSIIELAELICVSTNSESLAIIKGTKEFKFTSTLTRLLSLKSKIFSKIFYELLAYYQFLVLGYVANVLDLESDDINILGGQLNEAIFLIGKSDKKLDSHIKNAFLNPEYNSLVGSYLADDRTISNVSNEKFNSYLKITGFEKFQNDYIMMSYVVSYSRLLNTLEIPEWKLKKLGLWTIHTGFVNSFRDSLNKYFKETYPDKVK